MVGEQQTLDPEVSANGQNALRVGPFGVGEDQRLAQLVDWHRSGERSGTVKKCVKPVQEVPGRFGGLLSRDRRGLGRSRRTRLGQALGHHEAQATDDERPADQTAG